METRIRARMGMIVAATAAVGLIASKLLLTAGLTNVAIRFPLAALLSFGAFAWLLTLWTGGRQEKLPRKPEGHSGWDLVPDFDLDGPPLLMLTLVLIVCAGSAIYLIYDAPSMVATGNFRRMGLPMLAIFILLTGLGGGIHERCPHATKLSDVRTCQARPAR